MNKIGCLLACLSVYALSMEDVNKYRKDYQTLVNIKKHLLALAPSIKEENSESAISLLPYRGDRHNHTQHQTQQGFALVWEGNCFKGIIWPLGLYECIAASSIVKNGDKLFQKKIVTEFDAQEISRKPRCLSSRSGKQIQIGDQEIITYALQKLNGESLPNVIFKERVNFVDNEQARKICEVLETL